MFESAEALTRTLVGYVSAAAPDASVVVASVGEPPHPQAIEIRLLELRPMRESRAAGRPDVLAADYLVAIRVADGFEEHRLAADIMFALHNDADIEVVADRSAAQGCASLGMPIAAGLVVRAHVTRPRAVARAPLVRFPLVVRAGGLGVVEGTVLGPGKTPVAGAVVTLTGLDRSARTGPDGRFRIPGPLPNDAPAHLHATARGADADITVQPGQPAVLILPLEV